MSKGLPFETLLTALEWVKVMLLFLGIAVIEWYREKVRDSKAKEQKAVLDLKILLSETKLEKEISKKDSDTIIDEYLKTTPL